MDASLTCPKCAAPIGAREGDFFRCKACDTPLRVVRVGAIAPFVQAISEDVVMTGRFERSKIDLDGDDS